MRGGGRERTSTGEGGGLEKHRTKLKDPSASILAVLSHNLSTRELDNSGSRLRKSPFEI